MPATIHMNNVHGVQRMGLPLHGLNLQIFAGALGIKCWQTRGGTHLQGSHAESRCSRAWFLSALGQLWLADSDHPAHNVTDDRA